MRPSVRRRVLPVARPKYFLAAPLAAWALWAIFLPMLIADSFVFGDDRSRLRADSLDRVRCLPAAIDVSAGRLSTARPATEPGKPEPGKPLAAGGSPLRSHR